MNRTSTMVGALCLSVLAGGVLADAPNNTLTNPSFENADPFFPSDPEGWGTFNVGAPGWNTDYARTGVRSIALAPSTNGAFTGWTTNLFDENGDLYDPPYVYQGGDLLVSGWYLIPDEAPLAPGGEGGPLDLVTIKLEFRRVPPNFSVYQSFELPGIGVSTTGGQWVYYEQIFDDADLGDFPDKPGSVTILPFRFDTGSGQQGVIYWDDLCVYQITNTCVCDLDASGTLNLDDINLFAQAFVAMDSAADVDNNGSYNLDDINIFAQCFVGGCP